MKTGCGRLVLGVSALYSGTGFRWVGVVEGGGVAVVRPGVAEVGFGVPAIYILHLGLGLTTAVGQG